MKAWIKYLILGWSIVSVGITIVSFQIMKSQFIEEDYQVSVFYKEPEKGSADGRKEIGVLLFDYKDPLGLLKNDPMTITKKEFVDMMKMAKDVNIVPKSWVKDRAIYLYLPMYAFVVWAIPIVVFSLVGLLFSRKVEQNK